MTLDRMKNPRRTLGTVSGEDRRGIIARTLKNMDPVYCDVGRTAQTIEKMMTTRGSESLGDAAISWALREQGKPAKEANTMAQAPTKPKKQSKTLTTTINLWYKPDSESIAISFKEFGLISTVSEKPGSKRCHQHLYNHLRNALKREGLWPKEGGSEPTKETH